jgi:hypothetical protein
MALPEDHVGEDPVCDGGVEESAFEPEATFIIFSLVPCWVGLESDIAPLASLR